MKDKALGETCIVLGNGPSLADVDNQILESYPTFGTNGIFLKHIPDYYVTISVQFYKNYINIIRDLTGSLKFLGHNLYEIHTGGNDEHILNCNWNVYGNLRIVNCPIFNFPVPLRFSTRADRVVYLGGTVLFVCLQLAYWMGYQKIILLGVDHYFGFDKKVAFYGGKQIHTKVDDKIHFDPSYSAAGNTMHCDMLATERSFELALKAFQKDGREIFNATEGTGLDVIPTVKLEQFAL